MENKIEITIKTSNGNDERNFTISDNILDKKINARYPENEKEILDAVQEIITEGVSRNNFLGKEYEGIDENGGVVIRGNFKFLKKKGYENNGNILSVICGRLPHYKGLNWRVAEPKKNNN